MDGKQNLPGSARFGIQLIRSALGEERNHVLTNLLGVTEHIGALLTVDFRDTIQKVALESQRYRCTWFENLTASLSDILSRSYPDTSGTTTRIKDQINSKTSSRVFELLLLRRCGICFGRRSL